MKFTKTEVGLAWHCMPKVKAYKYENKSWSMEWFKYFNIWKFKIIIFFTLDENTYLYVTLMLLWSFFLFKQLENFPTMFTVI